MEWKTIEGFENYEVSNTGLVRSKAAPEYYLRQHCSTKGGRAPYPRVGVYKNNELYALATHILVAKAFVPNPDNKPFVNHKDFNTFNAHAYNLEWVTAAENVDYSKRRMNFNRYSINQLDDKGNIIGHFNSCAEAVKAMGGKNNGGAIAKAIKHHHRSYGYYWERSTTISEESTYKRMEVGDTLNGDDIVSTSTVM